MCASGNQSDRAKRAAGLLKVVILVGPIELSASQRELINSRRVGVFESRRQGS
jgi:hypothetical protein